MEVNKTLTPRLEEQWGVNTDTPTKHMEEGASTLIDDAAKEEVDTPSAVAGREIKNTIVLAISFLCVFTSYFAIQNLQGSLNDEGGLGVISLSCLYAANIISAVLAPLIVTLVGVKRVIIASFIVHLIYTASNFYPSFATLIPSSVLLGAVTGPLWTCQGVYLTACAVSYARSRGIKVFTALSRIYGIFWAVFDVCNIIGNVVSSLVLYRGSYNSSGMSNLTDYCGINDCPSEETADIIEDPEPLVVYILLGIFLGCVLAGIIIASVFLSPVQALKSNGRTSVGKLILSWFKLISHTDMKYLLPLSVYLAIAEVFCFAEITKSFISCPIGIRNVGYVMTAYGVSTSVSGFVFSRVAKYTTRYVLFSLAGASHVALIIWIYHWIPTDNDTLLIYVLVSVWGAADGLWKTQNSALLGKHFADNVDCAFAVSEGVKAVGYTASFFYSSMLCMRVKVSVVLAFLIVGLALYYFVEIRFIRKQKICQRQEEIIVESLPGNIES